MVRRESRSLVRGAALALALASAMVGSHTGARAQDVDPAAVERGAYVFNASGGCSCHTDVKNQGAHLAGGRALETPFGTFRSPNITPDPETGIGTWSDQDFIRAMREGVSPDGDHYFPAFPYPAFTGMSDQDLLDLKAYLFSLPAVRQANQAHDLDPPFAWRFLVGAWKLLNFEPGPFEPDPDHDAAWNRGAYLVEAVAHCGECHTPRDRLGGLDRDLWLAGTTDGPEGGSVPNITPDPETGIGRWSDGAIRSVLARGMLPDGDFVGGAMAEAGEGFKHLSDADLDAIIAYLRAVPPVVNRIGKPAPAKTTTSEWE
jgi:mono/diheme cytochrome c family protein